MKFCTKCRKDLTHGRRLKDSMGRYWCEACGEADSHEKHSSKLKCAGCEEVFRPECVSMVAGRMLCEDCAARSGMNVSHGGSGKWKVWVVGAAALAAVGGGVFWVL